MRKPKEIYGERLLNIVETKNYVTFDTETDLINKDISIMATPPEFVLGVTNCPKVGTPPICWSHINTLLDHVNSYPLIIGHNLAFDMRVINNWYDPNKFYWDTAIAEYEISGQLKTYPSLQSLAKRWLGEDEGKENSVSEMIKSGVSPKDIPKELLTDYCIQDVLLTERVFQKQFEYVTNNFSWPQINLLIERMKWRMVTYQMSLEGLVLNSKEVNQAIFDIKMDLKEAEDILVGWMHSVLTGPKENINPSSLEQIKIVLWGGEYKYDERVATGEYYKTGAKKGQEKTKIVKRTVKIDSVLSLAGGAGPHYKWFNKVDEPNLEAAVNHFKIKCICSDFVNFASTLLEYRSLHKNLSTYFEGYRKAGVEAGNFITLHTEYKHTTTPTGRISSTKPNVQNLKSG